MSGWLNYERIQKVDEGIDLVPKRLSNIEVMGLVYALYDLSEDYFSSTSQDATTYSIDAIDDITAVQGNKLEIIDGTDNCIIVGDYAVSSVYIDEKGRIVMEAYYKEDYPEYSDLEMPDLMQVLVNEDYSTDNFWLD
jgi:hypothetical protein